MEIPHFFSGPEPVRSVDQPFTIGVFGHLRETKRLHTVIETAERVRACLVLAGALASENLARSLAPYLKHPWITHTGALSEAEYWRIAQSVDVCVNLKYPSALETSGVGIQLMGIGKPVIFTEGPELEGIPEHVCLRVPHGPEEGQCLLRHLTWLADDRVAAHEIGRRASEFIRREHALDQCARLMLEVLTSSTGSPDHAARNQPR